MCIAVKTVFRLIFRIISKIKLKYVALGIGTIAVMDMFGAFTHIMETTYDESFSYPYDGDVQPFIFALRNKQKPDVPPINEYNHTFLLTPQRTCNDLEYLSLRIVFLVKSSMENFDRRIAIRNSWGFEKRFFDVSSKTVFLLGIRPGEEELQAKIKLESQKYQDIVQADFVDSYFNNTIKTMTGFRWASEECSNSKFYMFVDDDIYVSVKNVLRFVRNPANYPDYLKESRRFSGRKREIRDSDVPDNFKLLERERRMSAKEKIELRRKPGWSSHNKTKFIYEKEDLNTTNVDSVDSLRSFQNQSNFNKSSKILSRKKRQVFDFELPDDVRLYSGFVFVSAPHRHKTSKWYVSLEEYPYHLWPPYVTAGSYILSKEALLDMYYTSFYTKHFRFDDIFLGLVAKKADIEPFHCEEFHFYKKDYNKYNYKYVVTSHGYGNPEELMEIWNEQKAMGNA
ncbi:beta-1,3-galactosyltransferase brn [Belonocnema kinseyi]|uniref:beta-1,3-galactosyltransferase brn n=1 Tax=Belonocnema kinseyi TaxID=2817044 RepID=UPI00143D55AD|nr:beta-1,3-galactosyltransferase brn [Belonocnema kinseyi]